MSYSSRGFTCGIRPRRTVAGSVRSALLTSVLDRSLAVDDLLVDHFVRDLHRRLYGDIWAWVGVFRKRELNIGVAGADRRRAARL